MLAFSVFGLISYFTNWTLEITTLYIAGSLLCSIDPNLHNKKSLLAATHLFFQAGMFMNFTVIIVYWGVLHDQLIHDFSGIQYIHMYTVHTLPSLAFIINWYCTDIVLYDGHRTILTLLGVLYSCVNAYATISTGVPLYHFLTWQDYMSPLICVISLIILNLVFSAFVRMSRLLKPKMGKDKKK